MQTPTACARLVFALSAALIAFFLAMRSRALALGLVLQHSTTASAAAAPPAPPALPSDAWTLPAPPSWLPWPRTDSHVYAALTIGAALLLLLIFQACWYCYGRCHANERWFRLGIETAEGKLRRWASHGDHMSQPIVKREEVRRASDDAGEDATEMVAVIVPPRDGGSPEAGREDAALRPGGDSAAAGAGSGIGGRRASGEAAAGQPGCQQHRRSMSSGF